MTQSAKSKLCQNHNRLRNECLGLRHLHLGGDLRVTRSGAVSLTAEWFARSLYQLLLSLAPKFPPLEKSKGHPPPKTSNNIKTSLQWSHRWPECMPKHISRLSVEMLELTPTRLKTPICRAERPYSLGDISTHNVIVAAVGLKPIFPGEPLILSSSKT